MSNGGGGVSCQTRAVCLFFCFILPSINSLSIRERLRLCQVLKKKEKRAGKSREIPFRILRAVVMMSRTAVVLSRRMFAEGALARRPMPCFSYTYASSFSTGQYHLSVTAAKKLLGIPSAQSALSGRELRLAYFEAAKRCHPDSTSRQNNRSDDDDDFARQFHLVTEAYELLQQSEDSIIRGGDIITQSEEMEYRKACRIWLGIDAETVEESKQCPAFRQWLQGKTDAAFHWRLFFMKHGGLAKKLREPTALIGESQTRAADVPKSSTRRRRLSSRTR
jgi:hypothetical protein